MRKNDIPRPLCGCGKPVTYQGLTIKGFKVWKTGCRACENHARKHKKDKCEKCGTTKKLQVDHIDRNRSNNNPDNLRTLCHSCHNDETTDKQQWARKR